MMGRKILPMRFIENDRNRTITSKKRIGGILKKMKEIAILTGCHVTMTFYNFDKTKKIDINSEDLDYDNIRFITQELHTINKIVDIKNNKISNDVKSKLEYSFNKEISAPLTPELKLPPSLPASIYLKPEHFNEIENIIYGDINQTVHSYNMSIQKQL
jgi:hypothetical protein